MRCPIPIVFQQPDPVSPSLSAAQGFADTWAKLFPAIASLYAHSASIQAANQQQNAALSQQAQQFNVQQQNQGQLQTQNLQAQADQSQYQATQQSALQDQKTQNEAWLNQQALSQSDQMQQTRLQNHLSWLQGGEAADNLTPDQIQGEMNDTIGKLSYFQQRTQNATMNGIQQQGTLAGHVNAQGVTRQMADMRAQAQQMADMVVSKKLPDGSTVVMTPDGNGKWTTKHIAAEDTSKDDAKQQALQDKANDRREKVGDKALDHWTKVNHDAIASIDAKRKQTNKETGQLDYPELKDDTAYVNAIHAERGLRGVPEHTPEEHVAKKLAEYDAMTGRTPRQPAPSGNVASPEPTSTPETGKTQTSGTAAPRTQPAPEERKPYDFNQPGDNKDRIAAKNTSANLDTDIERLKPFMTEAQYKDAKANLLEFQRIWAHYGSPGAMGKEISRTFNHLDNVQGILKQAAAAANNAPKPTVPQPFQPNVQQGGPLAVPRF